LDMDVIVLSSFDPLRVFDATLGKEKPPKFIAGIMIGKRNATFFRLMHESYRGNYRAGDWDYNCAKVPYEIYLNNTELLHVEPVRLTTPDWNDRGDLWDRIIDWRGLYVIHLMCHYMKDDVTPQSIKTTNTTFGQVMRFTYYGSPVLIDGHDTTNSSIHTDKPK